MTKDLLACSGVAAKFWVLESIFWGGLMKPSSFGAME